jgi:hypothetical protein
MWRTRLFATDETIVFSQARFSLPLLRRASSDVLQRFATELEFRGTGRFLQIPERIFQ